ncbi:hypothetical protein [Flavivirga spongiicola]|uniref:Uncharacterized protein n=1 Tax=Flavivirga spongiicola TaxID=421621 RepID=A0ABU7Y0C1_9FLAO|nr:hypothetical protein [Flavivirga sp. MEBiC05379]MDO5980569.1 hypothetical protein [Flavivirga sp. MEBiC05379]
MKNENMHFPTRQNSGIHDLEPKKGTLKSQEKEMTNFSMANESTVQLLSVRVGLDSPPFLMEMHEIEKLGDMFTKEILLKDKKPLTLEQLVDEIERLDGFSAINRKMFLVAEGGQFKIELPSFSLNARLVFTWQKSNSSPPDFLLSTVPSTNKKDSLLQLISWSESDNSFHFFERKANIWGWAGNSFTSLNPPTRGKGPFDSHINGGLVMKELKFPWAHWHSQSNSIPREVFEHDSEFNSHVLFSKVDGAEHLENIVKTGIRRWTKSRINNDIKNSKTVNILSYFRQILTPTSVNLVSTSINFDNVEEKEIGLPSSFFFDIDVIEFAAFTINPTLDIVPSDRITISGSLYKKVCDILNMEVKSNDGITSFEGDTHFCFLVPERAFEDIEVCRQLVERKLLSPKMLLVLIMLDFTNPVESLHRKKIMKYCPDEINTNEEYALDKVIIKKIESSESNQDSPESELIRYWTSPDLLGLVKSELDIFMRGIQEKVVDKNYLKNLVILAEYRKSLFRKRKLNEFVSTISQLGTSNTPLTLTKIGKIVNL